MSASPSDGRDDDAAVTTDGRGIVSTASSQLGRPVGASGQQTRRRILMATMRCVAEVGYSRATIRKIARAADMTSGSLYHYFPNKAELLKATVEDIEKFAFPRLRAAASRCGDVGGRLDAVLDEADRLIREYPYLAAFERALRAESTSFLRSGVRLDPGFQPLRDILWDIVADAQSQGALVPGTDPAAATDALYALTRGLTEQAAMLPPNAYPATVQAAKRLIRGTLFTAQSGVRPATDRSRPARSGSRPPAEQA